MWSTTALRSPLDSSKTLSWRSAPVPRSMILRTPLMASRLPSSPTAGLPVSNRMSDYAPGRQVRAVGWAFAKPMPARVRPPVSFAIRPKAAHSQGEKRRSQRPREADGRSERNGQWCAHRWTRQRSRLRHSSNASIRGNIRRCRAVDIRSSKGLATRQTCENLSLDMD